LLADDYIALKDNFQAKATLQSVIENYKIDDDVLQEAKAKLQRIAPGSVKEEPKAAPADSTKQNEVKKTGNN
jgi:hypothetical protein